MSPHPTTWRSANIIAVYEKGNKKDPSNYRLISLTSVISKIMESVIRDFIMEHFFSNEGSRTEPKRLRPEGPRIEASRAQSAAGLLERGQPAPSPPATVR